MKRTMKRIAEALMPGSLAILGFSAACWAGPPPPPTIATAPTTPVGGVGITVATAVAIAGYGYWQSRK